MKEHRNLHSIRYKCLAPHLGGQKIIMILTFYCDESYDPPKSKRPKGPAPLEPKCYVVGGFISDPDSWRKIERRWDAKNKRVKVERFHASHLNARTWEYDGWTRTRQLRYSKDMLQILKDQKRRLHGMTCGLFVDSYRRIISADGQRKMGHPYLVCFKTCVATIAQHMDYGGFQPEDKFSVVVDRGEFDGPAVKAFYGMKSSSRFPHRHRLEACTSGSSEIFPGLQAADYVAYETFRLMQSKRNGATQIRKALSTMFGTTGFLGNQFSDEVLERISKDIDEMDSETDGFVVVPPYEWGKGNEKP
jgi:hypothetical protein